LKISSLRTDKKSPNATSKFLGVVFDKKRNSWIARGINQKYIGNFETEKLAALARDYVVKNTDRKLNFPDHIFTNDEIKLFTRDISKRLKRTKDKMSKTAQGIRNKDGFIGVDFKLGKL
jgi:hypothetical protein